MTATVQDLTIEAFLGLLVLLLAVSLAAVIRMPPMTGTTVAPGQYDDAGNLVLGWPAAMGETAPSRAADRAGPVGAPMPSRSVRARTRHGHYAPRHVHGYVPPPPQQGPPWEPADAPPS